MRRLITAIIFLLTTHAHASEFITNSKINDVFSGTSLSGTFVLYDAEIDRFTVYNRKRAETRFIPASTFKIPNTLIGLSTGAVSGIGEVFPYNGEEAWLPVWKHDMELREAFKVSNVLVYQAVARRITLSGMKEFVRNFDYGNKDIGDVVDQFWLRGPLKISAVEQAVFLSRLAHGELPVSQEHQLAVREIAKYEQGGDWVIYAKSGWVNGDEKIGWWVGWVEQKGKTYSFALNIDMADIKDAPERERLAKASLKALGLL